MGMIGRPEEQKELDGERPDRRNEAAPKLPYAWPEPPADISSESLEVWNELKYALDSAKFICHADRDQLRAYTDTVVRYRLSNRMLESMGPIMEIVKPCPRTCALCNADPVPSDHTGTYVESYRKNPLVNVVHDLTNQLRAMAREFGLTPSARSGIVDPSRLPASNGNGRALGAGEFTG